MYQFRLQRTDGSPADPPLAGVERVDAAGGDPRGPRRSCGTPLVPSTRIRRQRR